jgi:hypothetical protein
MQQRHNCVVVEEKTKRCCFVFGKERRTCSWRLADCRKVRANQDRIEWDLVERMEQIMIKDDCNRMRPLLGIGGRQKATDKRFESEDVEGKVFAVRIREKRRRPKEGGERMDLGVLG